MSEAAQLGERTEQLFGELDYLRDTGLAEFDIEKIPLLRTMTVEAGYAGAGNVTVGAVRNLLRVAIGDLDGENGQTMVSSAAALYGFAAGMDVTMAVSDRMAAAAMRRGIKERAYRNRKRDDMVAVALSVQSVHEAARLRALQEARRNTGLTYMPDVTGRLPKSVRDAMQGSTAEEWLERRHQASTKLWADLMDAYQQQVATIGALSPKVCVFASGSYGRDEAMEYSDLDLFLVDDVPHADAAADGRLQKFELAATLTVIDQARQALNIQRFSQSGYYQEIQSFRDIRVDRERRDLQPDVASRLTTARALLLANSKCLVNPELYAEMRRLAMDDYWEEEISDRKPLKPTFLINDLRRLWLTNLIDFEHFYPKDPVNGGGLISSPYRQIAFLKLGLPQKLGCYTPILGLLERCEPTGLRRAAAQEVLDMTTRQRLDFLAGSSDETIAAAAKALRELYGQYLAFNWCDKEEMIERVKAPDYRRIKAHFNSASTLILQMLWTYNARIPEITRFALV